MPDKPIAPGGAATINGIVYQLLWSLLQFHRLQLITFRPSGGAPDSATVILEPAEGGDLEVDSSIQGRVVDQVKSCPTGQTWPLRKLIEDVLPDLYKAVLLSRPTKYRFVTEGRQGEWQGFLEMTARIAATGDVLDLEFLDKDCIVYKTKPGKFWESGTLSEFSLFEFMVKKVRSRLRTAAKESLAETRKKLWILLGGFEFVPMQGIEELKKAIDQHLGDVVEVEDVRAKRHELLGALAELASEGVKLTSGELFESVRLSSVPLSERAHLLANNRRYIDRQHEGWRYDPKMDVRKETALKVARLSKENPILGVCGASGVGKSWLGYAISRALVRSGNYVVHLNSCGDTNIDLDHAASVFWEDIADRDAPLSIRRLAHHLKRLEPASNQLLTIVLDGVQSSRELQNLIRQTWGGWGIGLVAILSPDAGETMRQLKDDRCCIWELSNFTESERANYLTMRLSRSWHGIPNDVLHLLKTPLLAYLYSEIASGDDWNPESEYELFHRYWARKLEFGTRGEFASVRSGLLGLARTLLGEADCESRDSASWSEVICLREFAGGEALDAALESGWLACHGAGIYRFAHDRLLNWCVAKVLAEQVGTFSIQEICEHLEDIERPGGRLFGRRLGYVAMDVLWMVANSVQYSAEKVAGILAALESATWAHGKLYDSGFRTIGRPLVPALLERLRQVAAKNESSRINRIVSALAPFGDPVCAEVALNWLNEECVGLRRAAVSLLEFFPTPKAASRLWSGLCDLHESEMTTRTHSAIERHSRALAACVSGAPDWIRSNVRRSSPGRDPVHLLAGLLRERSDGSLLWYDLKSTLKEKIDSRHELVLVLNARRFMDKSEVDWLVSKIRVKSSQSNSNTLAGFAFEALVAIDPETAIDEVGQLADIDLYFHRARGFHRLLVVRPRATLKAFKDSFFASSHPIFLLQLFQGYEDGMDEEILNLALRMLSKELRHAAKGHEESSNRAERCMSLIAKVNAPRLLFLLEKCAGNEFEHALLAWLEYIGPQSERGQGRNRKDALILLDRVGGKGLTRTINSWLCSGIEIAVREAMKHAHKRPDGSVIGKLVEIVKTAGTVDSEFGMPYLGLLSLARIGAWNEVALLLLNKNVQNLQLMVELFEERSCKTQFQKDVLELAQEAIHSPSSATGPVVALGISGDSNYAHLMKTVVQSEGGSEKSRFALLGYCMLLPQEERDLGLLETQVTVEENRGLAIDEIRLQGSSEAYDVLLGELRRAFDDKLASRLIDCERTREETLEILWAQLRESDPWHRSCCIRHLGKLDDPEVRAFIQRRVFDPAVAIREDLTSDYIRALSAFDPAMAFLAACRRFQLSPPLSRVNHVQLLVELDVRKGVELLLDSIESENSESLLRAIAEVLASDGVQGVLDDQIARRLLKLVESEDDEVRARACRIVGWIGFPIEIVSRLSVMMMDPVEIVASAAGEALSELRRSATRKDLTKQVVEENGDRRRRLIDCCLEVGDVGFVGPIPGWAQRELDTASYLSSKDFANRASVKRRLLGKLLRDVDRKKGPSD